MSMRDISVFCDFDLSLIRFMVISRVSCALSTRTTASLISLSAAGGATTGEEMWFTFSNSMRSHRYDVSVQLTGSRTS